MNTLCDNSVILTFSKQELIDFHLFIDEIQGFFHQPLNFDNTKRIEQFHKDHLAEIEYWREYFLNAQSDLNTENNKGDFIVITNKDVVLKSCSCFNLFYLIMSQKHNREQISSLYNAYDYAAWKDLYLHNFFEWIHAEIKNIVYEEQQCSTSKI